MSNRLSLRILSRHIGNNPDRDDYKLSIVTFQLCESDQTIGKMRLVVIEAEKVWDADDSLFDLCDNVDQDVHDCYCAVYQFGKKRLSLRLRKLFPNQVNRNVLLLQRLEIQRKFRGRKLGLIAMQQAMHKYKNVCGLAAIKPFPLGPYKFDEEGNPVNKAKFEKACQKLVDYYKVFEFKRVGASKYYVLSFEDKLPQIMPS